MAKTVRLVLRVDEGWLARLKGFADEKGLTVAAVVRVAVGAHIGTTGVDAGRFVYSKRKSKPEVAHVEPTPEPGLVKALEQLAGAPVCRRCRHLKHKHVETGCYQMGCPCRAFLE